jgi:HSP20 family protein
MDKVTALLPRRGERQRQQPARADAMALREGFDRWLQQFFEDSGQLAGMPARWAPSVDARETDRELLVTAEVPGLDAEDIDLAITPEGLIIRGEKRETSEDTRAGVYVAECRYGSFVRTVPLPPGLDIDRAEARISRGVLTVRFPKVAARPGSGRIPIKTGSAAA